MDVLRVPIMVRVRRGELLRPGTVAVVARRNDKVHEVGRSADLVRIPRQDAKSEGIEGAIGQVPARLVQLSQSGDVRVDGIRIPVRGGRGTWRRIRGGVRGALGHLRARRRGRRAGGARDRKSTRLNSSHLVISYAGFCL